MTFYGRLYNFWIERGLLLKTKKIQVSKESRGLRLDLFLTKKRIMATRSQVGKLISSNQVLLNHVPLKASYRLNGEENLWIHLPSKDRAGLSPYDFPLDILFEDEEILIIDKPAGLVVHPSPGHEKNTLVNILAHKKNYRLALISSVQGLFIV